MKSSIVTTCNPTKPCLPNFHIVPLICSFQEIEIRHFFWYTNFGSESKGQTLK